MDSCTSGEHVASRVGTLEQDRGCVEPRPGMLGQRKDNLANVAGQFGPVGGPLDQGDSVESELVSRTRARKVGRGPRTLGTGQCNRIRGRKVGPAVRGVTPKRRFGPCPRTLGQGSGGWAKARKVEPGPETLGQGRESWTRANALGQGRTDWARGVAIGPGA